MQNIKIIFVFILLVILSFFMYQNSLDFKLRTYINNKEANIGIAVIKGNKTWVINNRKFPLLSVFKYFIALRVLAFVDEKKCSLDDEILIEKDMTDENFYSPMLDEYHQFPFKISIAKLLEYAISQSDNNACDILISYVGGMDELRNFIHSIGFKAIDLSVNEKQMYIDIENQYLNKAYPIDIARIMKYVHEGKILSSNSLKFLNEIMIKTSTGENKLKAGIANNAIIGHKTGSSSRRKDGVKIADNDAGYVIGQNGEIYYIVVLMENSKMSDAKNAQVISKISELVYKHLN